MEIEYCDICGRKCDGVHSNKINNKEKEIQKMVIQKMVNVIMSYDENMVDEIITRVCEIRRLKCKNV